MRTPRVKKNAQKPNNKDEEEQKLESNTIPEEIEAEPELSDASPVVSDADDEGLSEDDDSWNESGSEHSESEQSDLSEDEDVVFSSDDNDLSDHNADKKSGDDNAHGEDDHSGSDDSREVVEESDSSEDEIAPRNTVGDVPLEWYKDEEHIGYDLAGKKIKKKEKQDKLDSFLASADDSKNWRKIYDEYNDEEIELTKEEIKLIGRLVKGKAPHADFDPFAPYVDWFAWDGAKHPLSNAPEPKRRFIPSKWESKKVMRNLTILLWNTSQHK